MAAYPSYRSVGAQIIIMGLSGFYVIAALVIIIVGFILAVVLSGTTLPILLSIAVPVLAALCLLYVVAYLNRHYGKNGLMKRQVLMSSPEYIKKTIRVTQLLKRKKS